MTYRASDTRYDAMPHRRVGRSGLKLPAISLGLGWNFGGDRDYPGAFEILSYAFDSGITHFDLANNYGPPLGSAEELFGKVLARDFRLYRDEIIVSSKAGWQMWPGPYGEFGSRKHLISSCDQSLKRLGLDYVDIFYSHRFDPDTPLEETMGALAQIQRSGKALYIGISAYPREQTKEAHRLLNEMGVPLLIHQPSYSILDRWIEDDGTLDICAELGVGVIAYSPLARGVLSGKYRQGLKVDADLAEKVSSIGVEVLAPRVLKGVAALSAVAQARGQSLVELALAWVLSKPGISSVLVGARTREQLQASLGALKYLKLSAAELAAIDAATEGARIDGRPSIATSQ